MQKSTRRTFLRQLGSVAALPLAPALPITWSSVANAAEVPYDLLIAGGRVVDSTQNLSASRDVAISDGKIALVAPDIQKGLARQVLDASGKIVTPGLIDIHGHVYDRGIPSSIDPDVGCLQHGVTTVVDAGSTGANTFAGFRKYVIDRVETRVHALLNISTIGLVVSNEIYLDPAMIDPKAAIETIEANRPVIVGIKVRIFGRDEDVDHDIGVLQKAREAADATRLPIMLHWTNEPRLLALLKKGDILVHPFNPTAAGPHCLDANGKVYPQILELKQRGIYTDFAHGTHLDWGFAEQAAKQGWFPDTISTDLHRRHVPPLGIVFDLVTTMTKFVHLGLPVEEAIRKVTVVPAEVIPFPEKLGTLAAGATADVSVLDLQLGAFDLFDSKREKRIAKQMITSFATVKGGKLIAKSA